MNNFKGTAAFMRLIAEVSKSLSEQSIAKAFSEQSFEKAAQCKSTQEFLSFLKDLNLPELEGKLTVDRSKNQSSLVLDNLLSKNQLPSPEEVAQCVHALKNPSRGLVGSIVNGAITGASVGAVTGAVGGAVGGAGVGVIPGTIGGTIVGGIGGAIGGAISWASGD
jgi:hypothetical protein